MTVINMNIQAYLFHQDGERYRLGSKCNDNNAPNWIAKNHYAIKLKKEESIFFFEDANSQEMSEIEKLKEIATEKGIIYGDTISIDELTMLIDDR